MVRLLKRVELSEVLYRAEQRLRALIAPHWASGDPLTSDVKKMLTAKVKFEYMHGRLGTDEQLDAVALDIYKIFGKRLKRSPAPVYKPSALPGVEAREEREPELTNDEIVRNVNSVEMQNNTNERIFHLRTITGLSEKQLADANFKLKREENGPRSRTAAGRGKPMDREQWAEAVEVYQLYVAGVPERAIARRILRSRARFAAGPNGKAVEPAAGEVNAFRNRIDDLVMTVAVVVRSIGSAVFVLTFVGLLLAKTAIAATWKKQPLYALKAAWAANKGMFIAGAATDLLAIGTIVTVLALPHKTPPPYWRSGAECAKWILNEQARVLRGGATFLVVESRPNGEIEANALDFMQNEPCPNWVGSAKGLSLPPDDPANRYCSFYSPGPGHFHKQFSLPRVAGSRLQAGVSFALDDLKAADGVVAEDALSAEQRTEVVARNPEIVSSKPKNVAVLAGLQRRLLLVALPISEEDAQRVAAFFDGRPMLDTDDDLLPDLLETAMGLDPANPDTDHDGLADGVEAGLSLTDPLVADSDGDGLIDGEEIRVGRNPQLRDAFKSSTAGRVPHCPEFVAMPALLDGPTRRAGAWKLGDQPQFLSRPTATGDDRSLLRELATDGERVFVSDVRWNTVRSSEKGYGDLWSLGFVIDPHKADGALLAGRIPIGQPIRTKWGEALPLRMIKHSQQSSLILGTDLEVGAKFLGGPRPTIEAWLGFAWPLDCPTGAGAGTK